MSNTIKLKRSNVANAVPSAGQLDSGELAINYLDGNLFYKNDAGNVVVIASNQVLSVAGNVTGGNVNTAGQVSATGNVVAGNVNTSGNVTANYFIGDGSQLTNVAASGNAIINGNSNVAIATAGGNVDIAVNGVANAAQFGQASLFVQGPISTPKVLTVPAIMANNVNGVMISPLTIEATGNIFVPSGSTLTIFTPT